MAKQPVKAMRMYLVTGGTIGWVAVILQFYLIMVNRVMPVAETIVRFFSFFTILTNILVAVCFTLLLTKPLAKKDSFFSRPTTLTATTVYITIVGIIYNTVLRFIWNPTGLQQVVDELLHSVIPVFFILYWLLFVPKGELQWRDVITWLNYPLVYIVCILFRGALSGFYPYPFIDVSTIGYGKVFLNSIGLCIAFLVVSLMLVTIAKSISRTLRS